MCEEALNDSLAGQKFVTEQVDTSQMFEKLDNTLDVHDNTLMYNKIFEKVTFIANQRHILTVDLVKINLDKDSNFDKSDPDTIIHVRLQA